jgi:hypothetical protein
MFRYHFPCACGQRVPIELFQAGTQVKCPACQDTVLVPGSGKLQELAGDRYPYLSPLDKIVATAANREPPFDGVCHYCRKAAAEFESAVCLDLVVERHQQYEGEIRLRVGEIEPAAPAGAEFRRSLAFPLSLCLPCRQRFETARSTEAMRHFKFSMFAVFLIFIYVYDQIQVARMDVPETGVPAVLMVIFRLSLIGVAIIGWQWVYRPRSNSGQSLIPLVQQIPWVEEAIATADEFQLSIGTMTAVLPTVQGNDSK